MKTLLECLAASSHAPELQQHSEWGLPLSMISGIQGGSGNASREDTEAGRMTAHHFLDQRAPSSYNELWRST